MTSRLDFCVDKVEHAQTLNTQHSDFFNGFGGHHFNTSIPNAKLL